MIVIKFGYVIEYKAKLTKYQHSWLQKLLTKKKLITTYKVVKIILIWALFFNESEEIVVILIYD